MLLNYMELYEQYSLPLIKANYWYYKVVIKELKSTGHIDIINQRIEIIDSNIVENVFNFVKMLISISNINQNKREELRTLVSKVIRSIDDISLKITLCAIFCPGYTETGYKENIGRTTREKIDYVKMISNIFEENNYKVEIQCIYADIFLENTDSENNPKIYDQLETNFSSFTKSVQAVLPSGKIDRLSKNKRFSSKKWVKGFVDENTIKDIDYKTKNAFSKTNVTFYQRKHWGIEEIKQRNDKLLTIYSIISRYIIGEFNIPIYIPTENMKNRALVMSSENLYCLYEK